VRAPVAGFLKSVSCSEGEHIDAGQQVALLDVPELASKLAKVRAEMDQSRARIRMTHLGSHRVPVASVTEEADLREAEVTAEEAVLAGLAHEQEFLTQRQARLRVTTPVAGSVSTPRLAQQVGRYFSEGELICVVEDVSDVEAEIEIPEQSIRWVRVGQSVTLRPRATPMKAVEATVTRIAPSATTQPTQSAVHVYCELTDPELLPGMTGYARIHCPKRPAGRVLLESLLRILRTEYWW
jgi:multidrug efflux pump subunit AcrA (membrane-fusion protein)